MTNPFADAPATAVAEAPAAPAVAAPAAPPVTTTKAAPAAPAPDMTIGDPFADPTGMDGARITDFVGLLMIVKPTEIIDEMTTNQGKARDVVRADIAVLDGENPGVIHEGVLLFQMALKREAGALYKKRSKPYLIGRLNKGKAANGNTLYTWLPATPEERALGSQFLAVKEL